MKNLKALLGSCFLLLIIRLINCYYYQKCHDKGKSTAKIGAVEDYYCDLKNHIYLLKIKLHQQEEQAHFSSSNLISMCAQKADIQVGDTVILENIEIMPPKTNSPAFYFARNNILATIKTGRFPGTVIERPDYSIQRSLVNTRNNLLDKLRSKLSPRAYAFFVSLFFGKSLGDRTEHNTLWEWFNNWGIAHYLARSGLHIMLLIGLWRFLLVLSPLSYRTKEVALLLLSFGYAGLTFMSISFARALLMFSIYQICRILLLPYHGLYCCVLTCFILLIYNPIELFALDFQLTFLITSALLFFFESRQRHNSCPQKVL